MLLSVHTIEPRQLVDRQVAERPMVAVVEAGELGRDDPDRRGEHEQQRGGRAAPPEPHQDCRRGRQPGRLPARASAAAAAPRSQRAESRSATATSSERPSEALAAISSSLNPRPPHWTATTGARKRDTVAIPSANRYSSAPGLRHRRGGRMRVETARLGEVAPGGCEVPVPRLEDRLRWPTGSSRRLERRIASCAQCAASP